MFVGNLDLSLFHLALGALSAFGGCYQQHIFFFEGVYITVPSGIARTVSCFLSPLMVSASEERGKK